MSTKEQRDAQLVSEGWTRRPDGYWEPPRQVGKPRPIYGTTELAPPKKRIRQSTKPLMNKLEQEFFDMACRLFPNLPKPMPQAVTFRLANGVRYTPDLFAVQWAAPDYLGRPTAWEVKGKKAWDDAIVKIKVAAKEWPQIRWVLVWKEGTRWQEQEILP